MIQFDEHIFQMGGEKPPTRIKWQLLFFPKQNMAQAGELKSVRWCERKGKIPP